MGQQRLSLNGVKGRHFERESVLTNARKHVSPHSAQSLRPSLSFAIVLTAENLRLR
jgi:hypothetical protein